MGFGVKGQDSLVAILSPEYYYQGKRNREGEKMKKRTKTRQTERNVLMTERPFGIVSARSFRIHKVTREARQRE